MLMVIPPLQGERLTAYRYDTLYVDILPVLSYHVKIYLLQKQYK